METASARLATYWEGEPETRGDYLSRALLAPWARLLASAGIAPERVHRPGHCPFCGGAPWVAARRPQPETHGNDRMLCCALCGTEWTFARIRCPLCDEADPEKLPIFRDDRHPLVRIEACDVCRHYVKSIDLSEDGRPLPEVDDVLSLSIDLWAGEQGYTRIEPGLAGI